MITDRNDHIQVFSLEFIDMLGPLNGNIHPDFRHDGDGMGIEPMDFHTGGKSVNPIPLEFAGPAFGHLTPAGIPSAQK